MATIRVKKKKAIISYNKAGVTRISGVFLLTVLFKKLAQTWH